MLCILYLKSTHKNSLSKTNKDWVIDATLTPEDQIWSLAVDATAAATTYSDEVQATTTITATTKNNMVLLWE